jgi:hypothetical protein
MYKLAGKKQYKYSGTKNADFGTSMNLNLQKDSKKRKGHFLYFQYSSYEF